MYNNIAGATHKGHSALARLQSRLSHGKEKQERLLQLVGNMVITDALVAPSRMIFCWERQLRVDLGGKAELTVHSHALSQLSGVLEYPKIYINKLHKGAAGIPISKCRGKLVTDLNWHAQEARLKDRKGEPAKYLCRYVDGELRGFLSRNFKRHLASKSLLRAFVGACQQYGLVPVEAHASPVRVNLQCVLPQVFEPFDGEFVAVGLAWSNSDFGGGRMKVSMFMQRVNGTAGVVLDDAISEVHIGPVIEEADIEMSADTNQKELAAQKAAITDAVREQVHFDQVNKLLLAIQVAQEEKMPWHKVRSELGRLLQKKELDSVRDALLASNRDDGFEELPPVHFDDEDDPVATRYWAASIVGHLAEREDDAERKKELHELAGSVIGRAKGKK